MTGIVNTTVEEEEYCRYSELHLGDGDVIIYDTQQENSWIQSDASEPLKNLR